jgi:hypothetical protein
MPKLLAVYLIAAALFPLAEFLGKKLANRNKDK